MADVLVTGGAGFIGYFTVKRLLENGHTVTIVDNLTRGRKDAELTELLQNTSVRFMEGDLTNSEFTRSLPKKVDYIYHFAAVIGVKNVMEYPDRVLSVNARSILNMFEYAKTLLGLKKILFSSTSEIYAGTLKHFGIPVPTDETVPLTLEDISSERTTYALSKMFGESVCFNYGRRYHIPFTIVRYHNVYGPRMGFAHVIPEMFIKISKQTQVEVPSAKHTRAFCYVDDAVEMTVRLCEDETAGGRIFHIGNAAEEISIGDLARLIAGVVGKKPQWQERPPTPGSPERRCPDTRLVTEQTGYQARVDLREGLNLTYHWYKDKLEQAYE